jgi:hypothetical protein
MGAEDDPAVECIGGSGSSRRGNDLFLYREEIQAAT